MYWNHACYLSKYLTNIIRRTKFTTNTPLSCNRWGEGAAIIVLYNPFGHKLLQIYNDFVWTVSQLNRYMNNSLAAIRLPIRKPGPHNSCGPVGTLKWWHQSGFALKKLSSMLWSLKKKKLHKKKKKKNSLSGCRDLAVLKFQNVLFFLPFLYTVFQ